jgi:uncharacterized protein (TIGR03437 family)
MLLALLGTGLTANGEVLFNGVSSPILSVTSSEVLVRVPVLLEGSQTVQIAVNQAEITANLVDAAPALFATAVNQDGTLNGPSNPAARGGVITIFGTGEGVTGLPFSLTIGGYPAAILYAGPAGNYPGMFQINAQVPSGYFAAGTWPVVVRVGSVNTQPGVTVNIF